MSELLETILWLRPRTGALRSGLSQPATTGNFGIRVQFSDKSSGVWERSLFFQPPLLFRIFCQS